MTQETADKLIQHSKECGSKQFDHSSSFDKSSGDRTHVYRCRDCGFEVYEVVNLKEEAPAKDAA